MPISSPEGKDFSAKLIVRHSIKTILDVGAGLGTYSLLLKEKGISVKKLDAIEAWDPYITEYDLNSKYDNVFKVDARNWEDWDYDLVIFGDILEHMSKEDALSLWEKVSKQAKHALISIPIIYAPQGHAHGNPYEEHVKDDWTSEEVLQSFSDIVIHKAYTVVGVYWANFTKKETEQ
jgi:phospholipid N-methyltransferase